MIYFILILFYLGYVFSKKLMFSFKTFTVRSFSCITFEPFKIHDFLGSIGVNVNVAAVPTFFYFSI